MKRLLYTTVSLVLLQISVIAQRVDYEKARIGDIVPTMNFRNVLNSPTGRLSISPSERKTRIIYFWNTGCSSSIREWPRLMELQERFKDRIQIILANQSESATDVQAVVEKQRKYLGITMALPIICREKLLGQTFPRKSVPHLVWLDPDNKLFAITGADQLTGSSLEKVTQGDTSSLRQKDDKSHKTDFSKPLFVRANGGDGEELEWQSVISGYYPGSYSQLHIDSCYGIFSNTTLVTMLRFLFKSESNRFGAMNLLPQSHVQFRVKDSLRYVTKYNGEIILDNFYTYQLYSRQARDRHQLRNIMLSDLKQYFDIDCFWEEKIMPCLVLTAQDTSRIAYKMGEVVSQIQSTSLEWNNITLKEGIENLLAFTDYHYSPFPFIDETGLRGRLGHIAIDADINNYNALDQALNYYGLSLKLQSRKVKTLVIFERQNYSPPADANYAH